MHKIYVLLFLTPFFIFSCSPTHKDSYETEAEAEMEVHAVANTETEDHLEPSLWLLVNELTDPRTEQTKVEVDFSGSYNVSGPDQGYFFTLDITQRGDSLFGSYCGGTDTRSDCGMPSQGAPDCQVKGLVRGNKGYLAFRSCYLDDMGQAEITRFGQHIRWRTLKYPPEPLSQPYFVATPSDRILKSKDYTPTYASPARFNAFESRSKGFIFEAIEADSHYVYRDAKVYHQASVGDFKTILHPGKGIKIIQEVGSYGIGRIGDEVFEAPMYAIEYEEFGSKRTGFIHHEDLALMAFQDDRKNLFMVGFEHNDKNDVHDLGISILGEAFGYQHMKGLIPNLEFGRSRNFPAYECEIKTRPDLAKGDVSFIELALHTMGHEAFTYQSLLAWNGQKLFNLLPPNHGLISHSLSGNWSGEELQLEHSLMADKKMLGKATTLYRLTDDSLSRVKAEPLKNLHLAFLGENDTNSFSNDFAAIDWKGIRQEGNLLVAEEVDVEIEDIKHGTPGEDEFIQRKVKTSNETYYHFLFSGVDFRPSIAGNFPQAQLKTNERVSIGFPDSDWNLKSTGWQAEYSYLNMHLILTGTRDGQQIQQWLHFDNFREMPVGLVWSGDLDGDGKPDFILDLAPKGFYTDTRLYLSSLAKTGQLVGEAGYFISIEPGA